MLFFTRWKAAAILLTALAVCLCAVPNFFAESTVRTWPSWAQRHVVLGLDLQGGSHLLLEVDTNAVRKEQLQSLNDDVLRVLRQARIPFTGRAVVGNAVQVHITRDTDADTALGKLRELSQPLSGFAGTTGQRTVDVSENGGVITLTPTDPAITERVRQAVDQSIQIIERRVNELGLVEPTIQREGTDRILVQVPGLQDPSRLKEMLGKTAKLDFRMVDLSMTPEQAAEAHPPDSEILDGETPGQKYLITAPTAAPAEMIVIIIAMRNKVCRSGCLRVSRAMIVNRTPNWAMMSLDTSAMAAPSGPRRGIRPIDSARKMASCRDLVRSNSGPRLL